MSFVAGYRAFYMSTPSEIHLGGKKSSRLNEEKSLKPYYPFPHLPNLFEKYQSEDQEYIRSLKAKAFEGERIKKEQPKKTRRSSFTSEVNSENNFDAYMQLTDRDRAKLLKKLAQTLERDGSINQDEDIWTKTFDFLDKFDKLVRESHKRSQSFPAKKKKIDVLRAESKELNRQHEFRKKFIPDDFREKFEKLEGVNYYTWLEQQPRILWSVLTESIVKKAVETFSHLEEAKLLPKPEAGAINPWWKKFINQKTAIKR